MRVDYTQDEIDSRTLKLIVGLIALFLASLTSFLTQGEIQSISESYHHDGLVRNIFVGCLFAIASFLFAYNGQEPQKEALISKIAAVSALGVALFPCKCEVMGNVCKNINKYNQIVFGIMHIISAIVMFLILARFCQIFYQRAKTKFLREGNIMAKRRSYIYLFSGITIVLSMLILILDMLIQYLPNPIILNPRLVYWCEFFGLVAFGISWLTSSKILPFMAMEHEELHILKK